MGQIFMAEQFEKDSLGLLPRGSWYRHIVPYERAVGLPNSHTSHICAFRYFLFYVPTVLHYILLSFRFV